MVALLFAVLSFQEKSNKRFLIKQGLAGLFFFVNFLLVGAISAALFNLVNLVRGAMFSKNSRSLVALIVTEGLYIACFMFSLTQIWGNVFQIFLSSLTFAAMVLMTLLMWMGNGKHIRYFQLFFVSPAWMVNNIFNFSLGGILCELLNVISIIVSFVRYGRDGFSK